jgi:hypothetical protein
MPTPMPHVRHYEGGPHLLTLAALWAAVFVLSVAVFVNMLERPAVVCPDVSASTVVHAERK